MVKWIESLRRILANLFCAKGAERPSISTTTKTPLKLILPDEKVRPEMSDKLILIRPVSSEFKISSPYGERVINGEKEFHNGYDFACPVGTVVYACEDGAVFRCGWEDETNKTKGFGLRIWQEIERNIDGTKIRIYLWYGHLSRILVKEGDRIKKGQEIALSGNTGRTTGPHLHMEARQLNTKTRLEIEWS